MPDRLPPSDNARRERFHLDFSVLLLSAFIVVVLLWLTSELWLPHFGPDRECYLELSPKTCIGTSLGVRPGR